MKILHTADWQLGRQFSRFATEDCAMLSEARFAVIGKLRAQCLAHNVDAMLVAGDVFDAQDLGDTALRRGFLQLAEFPCPVVLLPGNHDADVPGGIFARAQALRLVPEQVVLARECAPILLCQDQLCVLPAPLKRRHEPDLNLRAWQSLESPAQAYRVGLAHGSVRGVLPEQYSRANVIDLAHVESARLDYLALGDWHGVFPINARCYYSGTPEPDRFRANEAGFALLVELQKNALPQVQKVSLASYQWRELQLHFDAVRGLSPLQALNSLDANTVLHLQLTGTLGLRADQQLQERLAALRAQLRAVSLDSSALIFAPGLEELADFVRGAGEAGGELGGALTQLVHELVAQRASADPGTQVLAMDALRVLLELQNTAQPLAH
jgi:DNA repair exonuclease SbcCD nuclease subunit